MATNNDISVIFIRRSRMTREEAITIIGNLEDKDILFNPCDVQDAKTMAIKALEQEPSGDLISRQAVQDYIAKYLSQYLYDDVREAVEVIDEFIGELPPVNPQEPKMGHWIVGSDTDIKGETVYWFTCSNCNSDRGQHTNYCPDCGAKMESEEKG